MMIRVPLRLLLSFLSLLSWTAFAADFSLQPRLCLHYPNQACVLKLQVSWTQEQVACLHQKDNPTALVCGTSINQQLQLELTQHGSFELRNQSTGEVLNSRQVKVLQVDLNAGDQLLKRTRSSWGTP